MAGTIFGLGLSQQIDQDGKPIGGGKLYITQNDAPVDVFKTQALSPSAKHVYPLEADGNGRIPAFWLADGVYRVRFTTQGGVPVFDEQGILAIGPSSGEGGGGGTVDPTSVRGVGDFDPQPYSGVRAGYVRGNGRTIGSATSGASERAHADCEPLFLVLWGRYDNTICPVVGGRGANAAADWAANKQLTLPDVRGKGFFGIDGMGSTLAGRLSAATLTSGTADTPMSFGGVERVTLVTNEMPQHTHAFTGEPLPPHAHVYNQREGGNTTGAGPNAPGGNANTGNTTSVSAGTPTGTNANVGGGAPHNNMPPFFTGTWYIKL